MRTFAIALCILFSAAAIADETGSEKTHAGEESRGKHALALFAGVTRENSENLATLGIEYTYRLHENWSVGGVIERADREENSTLVIAFVHLWPYKDLYVGAGIGRKDPGDERQNTFRGTIGYEFELAGGWSISPQANLDIIEHEEDEEVYGILFGKRF
ncbi:MAG: hypothetical protein O3C57_05545 [Verrucomicrobia bacterium]|nr:hypothetical protein [Verrucomicrobiota bacterium]